MDTRKLTELLRGTVDPNQRQQAEEQLQQVHKIIGFAPSLLQIIMSNDVPLPVRQTGVVYLKNFINHGWYDKDPGEGEPLPFVIHEQDKAMIRDSIIEAVVQAPPIIKIQFCIAIKTIVKNDFPNKWSQIVDKVSIYLQNPDPANWLGALLCLYQLIKSFEYQSLENRAPLLEAMHLLLPQMYHLIVRLLPDDSEQSALLQKQILKCFFALVQHTLPLSLITREVFPQWMEVFRHVMDKPVPEHTLMIDEEERPDLPWWKCKKWAAHILYRIFERFGNPINACGDYVLFAEWYLTTFTGGILEVHLKILDGYRNKVYVAPRVLQQILSYLDQCVSLAHSWKLLKTHMHAIIKDVLFRLMCCSEADEELWASDPHEYIRLKLDIFEDYISPVSSAQSLLLSCCKTRKGMLTKTTQFCLQVLTNPHGEYGPHQRDGALNMVGTLSELLLKNSTYENQIDDLLTQLVFPEFQSPHGFLRARACWVINYFSSAKSMSEHVITESVRLVLTALMQDKELPVKVEAALAIQMLLTHQVKARPLIEPQVTQAVLEVLTLLRETGIDDLTNVLQKFVKKYPNQLSPVAVEMCDHLATTFITIVENDNSDDEGTLTAMGLLCTIETIVNVMEDISDTMAKLEKIVLRVVGLILQENIIDHYEEALSLAYDLTAKSISEDMWKVLELIYQVFETSGFDFFSEMMCVLHNYITVDTDAFLSNENRVLAIFNMAKKILTVETDEESEMYAAKLLEVLVLQCQGKIDQCLPSIMELILGRLTRKIKTSELRVMLLQVLVAILYCNPELFFSIICKLQESVPTASITAHFIKQWIDDWDCFLGLHDRKLSVLGLCKLLDMGSSRPPLPEEVVPKVLPSCVLLFDGLKKAYVAKAEAEESDSESEEDSEEEDLFQDEVLESDEDEIDEMNSEYLDNLAKNASKAAKENNINMTAVVKNDSSDDEDDDDDESCEDDRFEGYTTPIDDKDCPDDEYIIFKGILSKLSTTEPALYQALTAGLTEEQQKALQDIFVLADQRQAQRDSKRIEQSGGYSFSLPSAVPTTFRFGS